MGRLKKEIFLPLYHKKGSFVMKKEFSLPSGLYTLSVVTWEPEDTAPKGVVQIVHGISEHIERYHDFALFLTAQGFLVTGCDLPGHGKTAQGPDEMGFFAPSKGWQKVTDALYDLAQYTKNTYEGLPFFLLGHSMGSFLVRTMMIRWPDLAAGYLLSGTGQPPAAALRSGLGMTKFARVIHGVRSRRQWVSDLTMGSYNLAFHPARTDHDWLSRDPQVADRYEADPLCGFLPTVSLFRDLLDGLNFIGNPKYIARIDPDIPVFIFSGEHDPVGERGFGVRRVHERFLEAGCQKVTLKLYPEGRHEMLNETNAQDVYGDVLDFLTGVLEAKDDLS